MKIPKKHYTALPFFQRAFPFLFILLFLFVTSQARAQCVLNCNDLVNVSIEQNGYAVVTPDMMLEHPDDCPGPKEVDILIGGQPAGDTVNCSHVDRVLMVRIRDITTGNFCTGSIRVQDKLGPLITCRDTIVPCGTSSDPDSLGRPVIVDNCDPNPTSFYVDSIVDLTCTGGPFNAIIYRRWQAKDNKNNLAVPCVQRIFFQTPALSDVIFPPNLDGIAGPVIDCSVGTADPDVTGWPTIDSTKIQGFCKFNVSYEDARLDLCQNGFKIIRRWTVLNCCTNVDTSAFQIIKVMDTTPPTILCADTLFVETNNDACASSFVLEPVSLSDDCSDSINISVQVVYSGGVLHTNGGIIFDLPLGVHEFIYTATDDCGNDTTCTTIVVVRDDDPPTPVCTEFLVVNINSTGIACIPTASFDAGTTDNCCLDSIAVRRMDEPDSLFSSMVCFTCEDVGQSVMVVVRFWDCFGNYNDCMTEVHPQDKIGPRITCPPDVTILCTDNPLDTTLTGTATATDNCDSLTFSFSDAPMLNMCNVGMIFRTWRVADMSGRKDSCIQKITVVDTTSFSIIFPPDSTVDCSVNLNDLDAGMPVFVSDCENFAIGISDTIFDISCGKKLRRRFRVIEWCTGFDTTYVQEIIVTDMSPPDWDQDPGALDTTFSCAADEFSRMPTATDFCSDSVRIEFLGFDSIPGSCPNDYMKLYRYLAFDTCGNVSDTFIVKSTVLDTIPPVFTNVPPDISLDCGSQIPSAFATATDNCGPVSIGFLTVPNLPGDCPAYVSRTLQTWIAEDVCGNTDTVSRTVFFIDTIPPTANPIPDSTYECPDQVPAPSVDVVTGETDNCGGPVDVDFISDSFGNDCTDTLFRIYRLTDTCGNFRDIRQRYFILDTIPPRITTCPGLLRDTIATGMNMCEDTIENLIAAAIDLCDTAVTVTNDSPFAFDGGPNANGVYPLGRHVFHFTATDKCGNQEQCTVDLTVVETDPPLIECLPAIIPIEFDTITGLAMVMPFDILNPETTLDYCSPISIQISPDKFDCDSLANGAIKIVTATVRDTFGNTSTCTDTIMLIDPNGVCGSRQAPRTFIAGQIKTPYNRVLKNTEVNMHCPTIDRAGMTNNYGLFIFDNMAADGMPAEIAPYKNDDPMNGVTTFDLVLMTKHILNTQRLSSPYKIIAADVNRSGTITIADVIELRKMILGIRNKFSNNTSWRFVGRHYIFQNPANPLAENFPEKIVFDGLDQMNRPADFVAIKVGDLNGNATIDLTGTELEDRERAAPAIFRTDDRVFKKGEKLKIPFISGEQKIPEGFQFTLKFAPEALTFKNVSGGGAEAISIENFGFEKIEKGLLAASWNGRVADVSQALFYLEFEANKDGKLSDALALNSDVIKAEWYDQTLEIRSLGLEFLNPGIIFEAQDFYLFQNRPNPFSGETQIEFFIKTPTSGVLEVTDVAGNVIFQAAENFLPGKRTVILKSDLFPQPGVYFYRLTTPKGSESKRMLLVR